MYKKLLSALLIMGSAVAAYAQPTLTPANFNPVAGEKLAIRICNPSGVTPQTPGANQVWNFTTLTHTAIDTAMMKSCSDASVTPSCSSFLPWGNQNIVEALPAPIKAKLYVYTSTDSIAQWGYSQSTDTFLKLTDPMITMKYPFTYMTNFTDSFRGTFKFGPLLTLQDKGQVSVNCDGWGKLQLPGRTDTALRVHMHELHRDSANIFGVDTVVTLDIDQYVWYKPGIHTPLLLIATATIVGSSTPLYTAVAYVPKDVTGVNDITAQATSIELFPNPSNGIVNIKWSEMELGNADVAVTDITGRTVYKTSMSIGSKAGQAQISLPEATSGIYFVSVKSGDVNFNGKISIQK